MKTNTSANKATSSNCNTWLSTRPFKEAQLNKLKQQHFRIDGRRRFMTDRSTYIPPSTCRQVTLPELMKRKKQQLLHSDAVHCSDSEIPLFQSSDMSSTCVQKCRRTDRPTCDIDYAGRVSFHAKDNSSAGLSNRLDNISEQKNKVPVPQSDHLHDAEFQHTETVSKMAIIDRQVHTTGSQHRPEIFLPDDHNETNESYYSLSSCSSLGAFQNGEGLFQLDDIQTPFSLSDDEEIS